MLTKRMFPLYSFSHTRLFSPSLFPKLLSIPTFSPLRYTSTTSSLSLTYGPSLHKGTFPFVGHLQLVQHEQEHEQPPFNETHFTRVFQIAAIRVPSDRCYELESKIRGHLLNWPRVPNIARVSGDEIDEGFDHLVRTDKNGDGVLIGERLSGVLYREKLAKEFNARGFVRFRNLAKISRPNNKKKRAKEGKSDKGSDDKGSWRKKSMVVEVFDESGDNDDLSGLLGEGFKGRKWKGSTRLLLLDERYAGRDIHELPEAVKYFDVANEESTQVLMERDSRNGYIGEFEREIRERNWGKE